MKNRPCIAYKIPLHEIKRAAEGVPTEELQKLTEPEMFDPELFDYGYWRNQQKPKNKRGSGRKNEKISNADI